MASREITAEQIKEFEEKWLKRCITPYKELRLGVLSIHDNLAAGYKVPSKVLDYLRVGKAHLCCMGIYEHPFKPGETLQGPYHVTDGWYIWDRDTWKYVLNYGLKLPKEFIDYVMSDVGTEFIEKQLEVDNGWPTIIIKRWKKN